MYTFHFVNEEYLTMERVIDFKIENVMIIY